MNNGNEQRKKVNKGRKTKIKTKIKITTEAKQKWAYGAADAVDVIVDLLGHVVINDESDVGDVETT